MRKNYFLLFLLYVSFFYAQNSLNTDVLEVNFGGDSEPDHIIKDQNKLYFTTNGNSIWVKNDLTSKSEKIFEKKNRIFDSRSFMKVFNNKLFFIVNDYSNLTLWKSDGTKDGTMIVKSFTNTFSSNFEMVQVGNQLFFTYMDNASKDLWKTDGTLNGTAIVKKINVSGNSKVSNLFTFKNKLYFNADDGVQGMGIWSSDGTSDGTQMLFDKVNESPIVSKNHIFFTKQNNGTQLWASDGSESGTLLIKQSLSNLSFYNTFQDVESIYFYGATAGMSKKLWKSNGTVEGTKEINLPNFSESSYGENALFIFKDKIFASGYDQSFNLITWVIDGNNDYGEILNLKFPSTNGYSIVKKSTGGKYLLFQKGNNVNLLFDGTESGTKSYDNLNLVSNYSGYSLNLVDYNDELIINATDTKYGTELFKLNPNSGLFTLLEDLNHSQFPNLLMSENLNNKLIFTGNDYSTNFGLYESDGTQQGTKLIKSLDPMSVYGQESYFFKNNDKLFFRCLANMSAYDYELCVTDGTASGTRLVKDMNLRDALPVDPYFMRLNDKEVLFVGSENRNFSGDYKLYKTDGTPENTVLVKNVYPYRFYNGSVSLLKRDFYAKIGKYIYFTVLVKDYKEIWKTDGTEIGTSFFFRAPSLQNQDANHLDLILNSTSNKFFYKSLNKIGIQKYEEVLWVSDGANITPIDNYPVDMGNSDRAGIHKMTEIIGDKMIYFAPLKNTGSDYGIKRTLYITDGTTLGTSILNSEIKEEYINFKKCGNKVYFLTSKSNTGIPGQLNPGTKLWVTDGTKNGTIWLNEAYLEVEDVINNFRSLTCMVQSSV